MSVQGSGGNRMNKSGWLRKQGGMVKSWHRRWFVLNGDYLFYFQKEDDVRPLGMIFLPGNKIFQPPNNPEEPDKFYLEIMPGKTSQATKMSSNHETFLLSAASDDERQDWIKAIRKMMFADKGGAIFGSCLEETMTFERTRSQRKVPYIVESCVEFLIANGLETEGLFRLPGRALLVRDLKDRFDEGESVDLEGEGIDVHSVASLLKQFFREMPESLIPCKCYQEFMNIAMRFQGTRKSTDKLEEVEILRSALTTLPQDNYNAIKYLCHFLHQVSDRTHINKMSSNNLARVFGPNIIKHPQMEDNPEVFMLTTADISEQLAFMLIHYEEKIFTIEFDSGRKSVNVAVDDLLNMDGTVPPMSPSGILQPQSAIQDLSSIIIDHKADRRARSFDMNTFPTDLSLIMPTSPGGDSDVPSPQSATEPPKPRPRQMHSAADGKPIAPLRRKYTRKRHPELNHTQSNDSISSENSENSENTNFNNSGEQLIEQRNVVTSPIDDGPNTLVLELQQKLEGRTAELKTLQMKYDNLLLSKSKADAHVKNLNEKRREMQKNYDSHIAGLETKHKTQINELCATLDEEKSSCAVAVQKIIELQKVIHNYQMQYGDMKDMLPPLYTK